MLDYDLKNLFKTLQPGQHKCILGSDIPSEMFNGEVIRYIERTTGVVTDSRDPITTLDEVVTQYSNNECEMYQSENAWYVFKPESEESSAG